MTERERQFANGYHRGFISESPECLEDEGYMEGWRKGQARIKVVEKQWEDREYHDEWIG
jgi:hypothetical protein